MRFYPLPKLVLEDLDSMRGFLEHPPEEFEGYKKWHIKAVPICDLMERIFAEKGNRFEYNDTIEKRAISEFGLENLTQGVLGVGEDMLGVLVYNAQNFVDNDYLIRNGYEPFTQEVIDLAAERGLAIEFHSGTRSIPKRVGDKWCAWVKYSQHRAYTPNGEIPVRLVRS